VWETATAAGQRQAQQAPLDLSLSTYPAKWQTLEGLTTAYIGHTLRGLGAFHQPGESHSVETLLAQTRILPSYHGLLTRWLKRLAGAGLLQQQGEQFVGLEPLPEVSLEAAWTEAQKVLVELPELQAYLERCGAKLAAVLTGQDSPLETLFPEGSFSTADFLYHDWSLLRYFNGIMQAVVEAVTKARPPQKQFRMLEIGAGTGGTAAALLPVIPPEQTLYYYTDVSEFFFARAEEKFKDYPFVRYGLFNAEQEPQAQGYQLHHFDLVVAANAIHATRDLHETLAHVRSLLAPGGLFLLFEATEHLAWFDITTGLIEGWGRFEDNLRQDNPLLAAEQWQEILQASGFEKIEAWPEAGSPAKALGQHIIIAQAPLAGEDREDGPAVEFDAVAHPGQTQAGDNSHASQAEEFMAQLSAALPDERKELLVDFVRAHVAKILRLPATPPLGRRERLLDLGLDSLMAVELRNRLRSGLGLEQALPATLVFDYPTIEAIAGYLAKEIRTSFESESAALTETTLAQDEPTQPATDVAGLSDEEVEALLLKKLESI
jgi:SAM-dependent methyltransferase